MSESDYNSLKVQLRLEKRELTWRAAAAIAALEAERDAAQSWSNTRGRDIVTLGLMVGGLQASLEKTHSLSVSLQEEVLALRQERNAACDALDETKARAHRIAYIVGLLVEAGEPFAEAAGGVDAGEIEYLLSAKDALDRIRTAVEAAKKEMGL